MRCFRGEKWGQGVRSLILEPDHPFWPVERPRDWVRRVNAAQTADELAALRLSVKRGRPFGPEEWANRTAKRLGLADTLRPLGRPRLTRE
jgi:hypothetical protein